MCPFVFILPFIAFCLAAARAFPFFVYDFCCVKLNVEICHNLLTTNLMIIFYLIKVIKKHVEEDGIWQGEADGPAWISAVCVE